MRCTTSAGWLGLLLIALVTVLVAGVASADVELFEGESAARSTSKHRVVAGSVKAVSGDPGVATVSKPTGDSAKVTITGVKEGTTTVKVSGKIVVFNVGVNRNQLTTERAYETYIDVTVKKPGGFAKLLVMKKNQVVSVDFPKNMRMTGKLTNSNHKVATVRRNSSKKLTVNASKKGTTTVITKLKVTEKGKTTTVLGRIEVEVKDELAKTKDKRIKIGWDNLFIGRIVIVNGNEGEKGKGKTKERKKVEKRDDARPARNDRALAPGPTLDTLRSFRVGMASEGQESVYVPYTREGNGIDTQSRRDRDRMLAGLAAERERRDRARSTTEHQTSAMAGEPERPRNSETGTDTGIFSTGRSGAPAPSETTRGLGDLRNEPESDQREIER
jgi:hypothetical protein